MDHNPSCTLGEILSHAERNMGYKWNDALKILEDLRNDGEGRYVDVAIDEYGVFV